MAIEKINFHYPKKNLQSVYSHEEMSALELAAATAGKVDECVEMVNGVEQSAIEARQIVDVMRNEQDNFILENDDVRAQLLLENQTFLTDLSTTNANFQEIVNTSKETFETNMTTAVNSIIENAETSIETNVNEKIDVLLSDGTIDGMINQQIMGDVKDSIVSNEIAFAETTGHGVIDGLQVLAQSAPNMSVLIEEGTAHLFNGKRYDMIGNKTIVVEVADNLNPRIDIIYISNTGFMMYGKGVPSVNPTAPVPLNGLVLAEINILQSTTMVTAANLTDKRKFKINLDEMKTGILNNLDEMKTEILNNQGNLLNLKTDDKSSLVNAINSFVGRKTDILKYGAKGDGIADDTNDINAAILEIDASGGGSLFFPRGTYKITSTINLKPSVKIVGEGKNVTTIKAFNCDAFTIQPEWGTSVERMSIYSVDAVGNWYPKTHTGIKCNGTAPAPLATNKSLFSELDIRGFNVCIDLRYTWSTYIEKLETLSCNVGVNLFGLSVNNTISNSLICVDNALNSASIRTQKDVEVHGEGLMITNCLLASGEYGVLSSDFLSLNISNCVIDLQSKNGLNLISPKGLCLTNSWVMSEGDVIHSANVVAAENQFAKITGNTLISSNGANGIFVGAANKNWIIANNYIDGKDTCLYIEALAEVIVTGNTFKSNNKYIFPIFLNGSNCVISNNMGDCAVQHYKTDGRNSVVNNTSEALIIQGSLDAKPTTGTWKRGDIIFYKSLNIGMPIGCVCVDKGTPGTWAEFGIVGSVKMAAQSNSVAADVATLVTDFNDLLAKLRTAHLLA